MEEKRVFFENLGEQSVRQAWDIIGCVVMAIKEISAGKEIVLDYGRQKGADESSCLEGQSILIQLVK